MGKITLRLWVIPFDEIVFDPKGQIGMELGVYATPETFLISREGLIIHKHIGEISEEIGLKIFYLI